MYTYIYMYIQYIYICIYTIYIIYIYTQYIHNIYTVFLIQTMVSWPRCFKSCFMRPWPFHGIFASRDGIVDERGTARESGASRSFKNIRGRICGMIYKHDLQRLTYMYIHDNIYITYIYVYICVRRNLPFSKVHNSVCYHCQLSCVPIPCFFVLVDPNHIFVYLCALLVSSRPGIARVHVCNDAAISWASCEMEL